MIRIKRGSLTLDEDVVLSDGSGRKVRWLCDCGKSTIVEYRTVIRGNTQSCGRCDEISAEEMAVRKCGKLRMKFPKAIIPGSGRKETWLCDCGREAEIRICSVLNNPESDCGRCNEISVEEVAVRKFGKEKKLRMKHPRAILPGSNKKEEWLCDCGNTTVAQIAWVTGGNTNTCGRCNEISAEEVAEMQFGNLRIAEPQVCTRASLKEVLWLCKCGGSVISSFASVFAGKRTKCGRCKVIPGYVMATKLWGRLRMKFPQDTYPGSTKKTTWICLCGEETDAVISAVTRLGTTSCGWCRDSINTWFLEHQEYLRSLKAPITPAQIPSGGFVLLDTIQPGGIVFRALCPLCGEEYGPRWYDIRLGKSLTCGCMSNRASMGQKQVFDFIRSLGIEAEMEHEAQGLKYDIYVPSNMLLIEYNGLKWHSMPHSRERDLEKYRVVSGGYNYLMIYEDEWKWNRSKVENLIRNKFGQIRTTSIRPSVTEIRLIPAAEADPFYESHHYIGKVHAPVNYGVFYQDKLIACASFKHPTRQSSHPWELVRMSSDGKNRVHGIWSKIMALFVANYAPSSIVSFSDNRLFNGSVYEKIGFRFDGEVDPDYYWCKDNRRFHKSALRKTDEEKLTGKTETELREAQGYRKIWDLGKKRWVWTP